MCKQVCLRCQVLGVVAGEVPFIGGSLNIFGLWSESQLTSAQCHKGDFDGKEREKKKKRVVLGQSIGYPFKPEHSTGRFSKCQSHFWLWTDSLMDHSDDSVGGL